MPRKPRAPFLAEGGYYHVYSRAASHRFVLAPQENKEMFLGLLDRFAHEYHILLHGWGLMGNHFHVVCSIAKDGDLSSFMGKTKETFTKWFHKQHAHENSDGPLWKERFRMNVIEGDREALSVLLYNEDNSRRAGKVKRAWEDPYNSSRYYALGIPDPRITPLPSYVGLSATGEGRKRKWRQRLEAKRKDGRKVQLTYRKRPYAWIWCPYVGRREYVKASTSALNARIGRTIPWREGEFVDDLTLALPGG